ncbi:MAG TPA: NAD(P)H-hydrate dehydratase [Planctomycetota bacterium]|jgi:NAD(P)H-hydrate epimerase|nr:NAD(P)H-hydrate dehydratase [Planctomycetota bacterium]
MITPSGPHAPDPREGELREGDPGDEAPDDISFDDLDPADYGLNPRDGPLTLIDFIPPPPPPLKEDGHKGEAGRVLCLCGSADMPGAASLVARAASRVGAGLVTVGYLDVAVRDAVAAHCCEATFLNLTDLHGAAQLAEILDARSDHAVVLGPGLGQAAAATELVRDYFACDPRPTVLDADGLNIISANPSWVADYGAPLVITPHEGEARRLLGRPIPGDAAERAACARELAESYSAVCCLKGMLTVITDGASTSVNLTGNPGMATAGSGDVLSGAMGALLAASAVRGGVSFTPYEAARCAVYLHGLAGDLVVDELCELALVASDLVDALGPAIQVMEGQDEQAE